MRRDALGGRTAGPAWRTFEASLVREIRAICDRTVLVVGRDTNRDPQALPAFRLDLATLDVMAAFSRDDAGAFTSTIALGTVLALDDLALLALSDADVLVPRRSTYDIDDGRRAFELDPPLSLTGARSARPDRFVSYDLARRTTIDFEYLTASMPLDDWRLAQASLLSELAIAWVVFHEIAHWALGHQAFFARGTGALALVEGGAIRAAEPAIRPLGNLDGSSFRQELEHEADRIAFLLLHAYARPRGGPVPRYHRFVAGNPALQSDPRRLARIDAAQRVRLCVTAASLACMVLEFTTAAAPPTTAYPPVSQRLQQLYSIAAALVPGDLEQVADELRLIPDEAMRGAKFSIARFAEALGMGQQDLRVTTAAAVWARSRRLRDDTSLASWTQKAWRRDLGRSWRPHGSADPLHSEDMDTAATSMIGQALRAAQMAVFGAGFEIDLTT